MNKRAFSLIELLVVVTIIGILAAIALPQFNSFKTRAYDAKAESTLRSIITAEEAYFVDNNTFTTNLNALPGFSADADVTASIATATSTNWSGSSYHPTGTQTYCYNSANSTVLSTVSGTAGACP